MSANRFNSPRRIRGLSLIELMIALTIGLIITLAVGQVYIGSRTTYRTQDALSRLQENARYAMDTISHDLRMAGQIGCSVDSSKSANVLNNAGYGDLFGAIKGAKKGGTAIAPFTATTANSDVIRIFRADETTEALISNSATPTLNFAAAPSFNTGDILVATDCSTAAVFQASNVTGTAVKHQVAAMTPGNCTDKIGPATAPLTCPGPGTTSDTFPPGTKVMRVIGNLYYVANNSATQPALYRQKLVAGVLTSDELVEGVEDMQITYGLDTDPPLTPGYGSVDTFVSDPTTIADWGQVKSVQISLLMRTAEDNVSGANQQYIWRGASVTAPAGDRHLRMVFSTTISLRDR